MNNNPVRREDVICRQLNEAEAILYDMETGCLHVLNSTAMLIWEACDGAHTLEDMVAVIKEQYDRTDNRDVAKDVQVTLNTFAAQGLLQHSDHAIAAGDTLPTSKGAR
jgi:hypothetical protein